MQPCAVLPSGRSLAGESAAPEMHMPGFDPDALRQALADPSGPVVRVRHRAGLLAHPRALAMAEIDPSFSFEHQGPVDALPIRLKAALRDAGLVSNKAWEALHAEVSYLVRVFASLAEDPEPCLRLAAEGAPAPLPPPPSRLALTFDLAPLCGGGPAETAAVAPASRITEMLGRPSAAAGRRLRLCLSSARMPSPAPPDVSGTGAVDIVLASLPFGIAAQPSLALSLLKNSLPPGSARVLYLTLPFARRIGLFTYSWIAEFQPFFTALLGEWLFAEALFPGAADPWRYLDEVLLAPTRQWFAESGDEPSFITLVPEGAVADILRVREAAGPFLEECAGEVLAGRPRVVGLTSIFQQHAASLALARRLKERAPGVVVVLGGSNCEGAMGLAAVRSLPFVDAVVSGEGDVAFPRLVERVLAGQPFTDIPGVYTRTSPEALERSSHPPNAESPRDLDGLPWPDFDDFFVQLAQSGLAAALHPRLLLETARGCWWGARQHCTFCGLNGSSMAFRSKSPERALDELRTVARRHPGVPIGMADNILDMGYLKTVLPRLAGEGLDLELFYEVKANLKKDELRVLRAAGVASIQPGIESFSDEILRLMRKGVTGLQNVQLLKWCQELGVWPFWNLLWGFPGEPPEEYARMAELLPRLHHLPPPAGMSPIFLERFSPNFERSGEMGFTGVRPIPVYGHIYPFAAEEMADLAYFFRYEYRDGRHVAGYTQLLAQRIVEWREAYGKSRLLVFDRGDHLMIYDTRPMASTSLRFVEGLARTLYLACDGIRGVESLGRLAAAETGGEVSRERIEEILGPLVAGGLLMRQGDSVLALATPGTFDSERK